MKSGKVGYSWAQLDAGGLQSGKVGYSWVQLDAVGLKSRKVGYSWAQLDAVAGYSCQLRKVRCMVGYIS